MLSRVEHWVRRFIFAWPFALIGIVFVHVGGGCIHLAAFIADIDVSNDEEWL